MNRVARKVLFYIFIVIDFLLALKEIHAEIRTAKEKRIIASVSIMSIEPVELDFVVICKKTKGNLKTKCKVLKEYIFDSDSMDQYSRNLIRELEATKKIVVTDSEYRIVDNNLRFPAYNNYYRHVLSENHGIITIEPFQQMFVQKLKLLDTSKSYRASTIFNLRFNMKGYKLLDLELNSGDNENLINWFKDKYIFNERFNLLNSRDVQCGSGIFQAAGAWHNCRANMEITIGDSIDNLGYFNDTSCEVESDVDVYEILVNYSYSGLKVQNFNIICTVNGICYINLAENENFIPQLAFGKNNNFKICITENIIRFITCDKFNLLVFYRPPNA